MNLKNMLKKARDKTMKKEDKNDVDIKKWAITLGITGLAMIILPILLFLFKIHVVAGLVVLGILLVCVSLVLFDIWEG